MRNYKLVDLITIRREMNACSSMETGTGKILSSNYRESENGRQLPTIEVLSLLFVLPIAGAF